MAPRPRPRPPRHQSWHLVLVLVLARLVTSPSTSSASTMTVNWPQSLDPRYLVLVKSRLAFIRRLPSSVASIDTCPRLHHAFNPLQLRRSSVFRRGSYCHGARLPRPPYRHTASWRASRVLISRLRLIFYLSSLSFVLYTSQCIV